LNKKTEKQEAQEHQRLRSPVIYEIVRREGTEELRRPTSSLWWSGLAAGVSISASLLATGLLVHYLPEEPWTPAVTSFGYCFGFLIVVLGRLQQFAPPQEVYRAPANRFVAGFIGTPSMNLVDGELLADEGRWRFRADGIDVPVPDLCGEAEPGPACLGVRPEHLHIGEGSFRARVALVEQTGHENIVVIETAEAQRLTGRTPAAQLPTVGDELFFAIDAREIHVFSSAAAGRRLNAV